MNQIEEWETFLCILLTRCTLFLLYSPETDGFNNGLMVIYDKVKNL